jgi:hypothetical protein
LSDLEDLVLMEGGEKVTTRWWVAPAAQQDQYDLYVVRYHEPVQDRTDGDRWADWSENLNSEGRWRVAIAGAILEPTLSLSGLLVHTLSDLGALVSRQEIAAALHDFCARVIISAVAQPEVGFE